MSQTTMSLGGVMPAEAGKSRLHAILVTLGEKFVEAQQARADRLVRPYLARMSEGELSRLGFTSAQIGEIRKDRHLPVVRWV